MNPLRPLFPCFAAQPDWVYLDSAATAQKPQAVIDALLTHYRDGVANVHRAAHRQAAQITRQFETARRQVAQFLNAAETNEIVWTRGSTEAINLVAQSFLAPRLQAGDAVVISALEHHANLLPWQQLAQKTGAALRVIPVQENGELDLSVLPSLLDARVKLLAVTAMSNVLGTLTPVADIVRIAHVAGVPVLVDAAQAAVHQRLDVRQLNCDFLVCSGHKLYGPSGIGVLYGKHEHLQAMQPWQYGGEMVARVQWDRAEFQPPPLRFEAGTPAVADAIGLAAALEFLQAQDRHAAQEHEAALLQMLERGLDALPGVRRLSRARARAAIVAFTVDKHHPADIAAALDSENIAVRAGQLCASPLVQQLAPGGIVRASLALYSDVQDVQRLLDVLTRLVTPASIATGMPENFPATIETANSTGIKEPVREASDSGNEKPENTGPEKNAQERLVALLAELRQARGWANQQRLLMKLADIQPRFSVEEKSAAVAVQGCESQTWLRCEPREDGLHFTLDSEARIVRGLAAVLLSVVNGKPAAAISQMNLLAAMADYRLENQLSVSRVNGVKAIAAAVINLAKRN